VGHLRTLWPSKVSRPDGLNGRDIHRLENITTMDNTGHVMFEHLPVWLEATVSGGYKVRLIV
jgi:hypothetical protein